MHRNPPVNEVGHRAENTSGSVDPANATAGRGRRTVGGAVVASAVPVAVVAAVSAPAVAVAVVAVAVVAYAASRGDGADGPPGDPTASPSGSEEVIVRAD